MPNRNGHIRGAVDADLGNILDIESACYEYPWSIEQFREELKNPVAALDVYVLEGQIVAYLCSWLVAEEMQILNLATAPHMRRMGIAARLLEHAFDTALPSLQSAWLEVRAGNHSAIILYEKLGFRKQGVRRAYYRDGEDALLMEKKFHPVEHRGEVDEKS